MVPSRPRTPPRPPPGQPHRARAFAAPCNVRMPHKVVLLSVVALWIACMERKMDRRAFSAVRLDEQVNVEKRYCFSEFLRVLDDLQLKAFDPNAGMISSP